MQAKPRVALLRRKVLTWVAASRCSPGFLSDHRLYRKTFLCRQNHSLEIDVTKKSDSTVPPCVATQLIHFDGQRTHCPLFYTWWCGTRGNMIFPHFLLPQGWLSREAHFPASPNSWCVCGSRERRVFPYPASTFPPAPDPQHHKVIDVHSRDYYYLFVMPLIFLSSDMTKGKDIYLLCICATLKFFKAAQTRNRRTSVSTLRPWTLNFICTAPGRMRLWFHWDYRSYCSLNNQNYHQQWCYPHPAVFCPWHFFTKQHQ